VWVGACSVLISCLASALLCAVRSNTLSSTFRLSLDADSSTATFRTFTTVYNGSALTGPGVLVLRECVVNLLQSTTILPQQLPYVGLSRFGWW
jgi:hypothetical protein